MLRYRLVVTASLAVLALAGCSPISPGQSEDAKALVGQLAIRDANVANTTGVVECGEPRDHLLAEEGYPTVFRTICRVYFDDGETDSRYKDMICIGDFEASPISEKCYVWLPYYPDGVPAED